MPIKPVHPVNILLPLPIDTATAIPPSKPAVSRRRSSTFTAITNWALAVQPGTPAPVSPNHRPSIVHSRARSGSSSFLHLVETPARKANNSESCQDKSLDLTSHGYTSVFVHLPYTPTTPSPYLRRANTGAHENIPVPPIPPTPKTATGLKRIRSFGMLKRARAKSNAAPGTGPTIPLPPTPTMSTHRSRSRSGSISPKSPTTSSMSSKKPVHGKSKSFSASTTKREKKSTAAPPLPPSLASELLLMQFVDGGSLESHAHKMMEKQAKAAAPAGRKTGSGAEPLPMNTVYRDENGTMWWDEEEALEYKALLDQPPSPITPWVHFDNSRNAVDATRKGSVASVFTTSSASNQGSPVDLSNVVTPANVEAYGGVAMQVLNVPASASANAGAQNKRTRRRPAPLKLRSADDVHNLNIFEDSFVPVIPVQHSPTAPESAPPVRSGFDTDRDGDAIMNDGRRNGMVFASPTNPIMIMKKASKMGLKVRAKAFFGAGRS